MISCTEFIPSYSELFSFLDENYGFEEVKKYWDDVFDPERNGILNRKVKELGIRGCYEYWNYSLNEEAADFRMMLNEKDGWFTIEMRHCPSKGRLLEMKQLKPFHSYCLHCDLYRRTVEKYGLCYDYDFTKTDKAQCAILIYDPKVYKGTRVMTPDTLVTDRTAADNKYLHREFHNYMSIGVEYLVKHFGKESAEKYLRRFAHNYYAPVIREIRAQGLKRLAEMIGKTYDIEEASESLHMELSEDVLNVKVDACPAVTFMKEHGWEPSEWYYMTTETVMAAIAEEAGLRFRMLGYDSADGKAEYRFEK